MKGLNQKRKSLEEDLEKGGENEETEFRKLVRTNTGVRLIRKLNDVWDTLLLWFMDCWCQESELLWQISML